MKTLFVTLLFGLLLSTAFGSDVNIHAVVPEVHLKDGTVLQNVKFVSYAATSVMAKWDGGRGTIPYAQLPVEMQEAMKEYIPEPSAPIPTSISVEPDPAPGPLLRITGQVFVVTKGGENFKLGLVEVGLYPAEAFKKYKAEMTAIMAPKENELKVQRSALMAIDGYDPARMAKITMLMNQTLEHYYSRWDLLPSPSVTTKTDAEGHFVLSHTLPGQYVVFARAKRRVGKQTEMYVWAVESAMIADPSNAFLSNDNLDTSWSIADDDDS